MPGLLQGYFLASFLFMAIVFSLPICLGLSALALDLPVGADSSSVILCLLRACHHLASIEADDVTRLWQVAARILALRMDCSSFRYATE